MMQQLSALRDAFVQKTLGITLYEYQKKFSDAIIKNVFENKPETITAEFSRQSGKTEAVCTTIIFLVAFYYYVKEKMGESPRFFNIGVFAPQQEQSRTDFDRIKDYLNVLCRHEGFDLTLEVSNGNTIRITSNSHPPITIYCFTLSPTSHPESKTLNLIIYEESQDLLDVRIDKTASPMGAATAAVEVFIGTAGYSRCKFWRLLSQEGNTKIITPCFKVIEEKQAAFDKTKDKFHLNYEVHIQKKIRELGGASDEFRTQYALEWVLERGQFVKFEDLFKLQKDYNISFVDKFGTCFVGIDWGKANDSTVMTVVNQDGKVLEWVELQGDDYYNQYEYLLGIIKVKFPGARTIFCDSTGTQDQAVDMLRVLCEREGLKACVEGVKFSAQSKDFMFKNLARLMFDKVVNGVLVEPAFLAIPRADGVLKERFMQQFVDLQKEVKGDLWSCHHPEGNYHDDFCASLALACLGFAEQAQEYVPRLA